MLHNPLRTTHCVQKPSSCHISDAVSPTAQYYVQANSPRNRRAIPPDLAFATFVSFISVSLDVDAAWLPSAMFSTSGCLYHLIDGTVAPSEVLLREKVCDVVDSLSYLINTEVAIMPMPRQEGPRRFRSIRSTRSFLIVLIVILAHISLLMVFILQI